MATPKVVPYINWNEWLFVKHHLFHTEKSLIETGLNMILMWKLRGRLPHAVEATANLIQIKNKENLLLSPMIASVENEIRLLYSICIIRSVNGLVDAMNHSYYAATVLQNATDIGLPSWIVELRHESTHNQLPSLNVLRSANQYLIQYFIDNYWNVQSSYLQTLTGYCIQYKPSNNSITNVTCFHLNEFKQHISNQSPTLIQSIFIPTFISSIIEYHPIMPNPSSSSTMESFKEITNQSVLQHQETKAMWWGHINAILNTHHPLIHTLLCNLFSSLINQWIVATQNKLSENHPDDQLQLQELDRTIDVIRYWIDEIIHWVQNKIQSQMSNVTSTTSQSTVSMGWRFEFQFGKLLHFPFLHTVYELVREKMKARLQSSHHSYSSSSIRIRKIKQIYQHLDEFYSNPMGLEMNNQAESIHKMMNDGSLLGSCHAISAVHESKETTDGGNEPNQKRIKDSDQIELDQMATFLNKIQKNNFELKVQKIHEMDVQIGIVKKPIKDQYKNLKSVTKRLLMKRSIEHQVVNGKTSLDIEMKPSISPIRAIELMDPGRSTWPLGYLPGEDHRCCGYPLYMIEEVVDT